MSAHNLPSSSTARVKRRGGAARSKEGRFEGRVRRKSEEESRENWVEGAREQSKGQRACCSGDPGAKDGEEGS